MREDIRTKEGNNFQEEFLENTEPIFDRTPEVELPPSTITEEDDEDNIHLRWAIQRMIVPITNKGKEKVIEEKSTKKPSTRGATQKLMSDVMKSSKATKEEERVDKR
ncbi:hypothetical protein KY289_001339 [Solanum tuberosum]|nr:hypothetical protein KY289_001339 [Solanum tuberosum]